MTQDGKSDPPGQAGADAPASVPAAALDRAAPTDSAAGPSVLATAAIAAAINVVLIASAFVVHDRVIRPVNGVATVDVEILVRAKEALVADELTRVGAAGSPGRAYDLAGSFTRDLTLAIREAQVECRCDIFVRAAVVSTPAADLTQTVADRLGLRSDDIRAARDRLRGAIQSAAPNPIFPSGANPR